MAWTLYMYSLMLTKVAFICSKYSKNNTIVKYYITLTTRVMILKIQLCHHRNELHLKIF